MKRLCCIFIFFTIGSYYSFGQQYPFIRFTPRDGLVNANVLKVFQDTKGRMYFLTTKGFSIYDGTRFINYTMDDGLPNETVNDIIEITPDSLLLASNTDKLTALVRGQLKPVEMSGFTQCRLRRQARRHSGDSPRAPAGRRQRLEGCR